MRKTLAILIILVSSTYVSCAYATNISYNYTGDNIVGSFGLYNSAGIELYDFIANKGNDDGEWVTATSGSLNISLPANET